jgi:DNA polymerase-3 subunit delta'
LFIFNSDTKVGIILDLNFFIGHNNIKEQINKSIDKGMFSHAHLIAGENGIGKSLLARFIALKLLQKSADREYADIVEFRVQKNKMSIGIKEVVENIITEINKKPYEGDKKVIIIYEAHKMTTEAQNAFLKTIEEPPKGVFIILLCETLEGILETIKSRCQIHKLQRLSFEEMSIFIERKYPDLGDKEKKAITAFSDGIPGRAERFMDDESFQEMRDSTLNILQDISRKKPSDFLKYEAFLVKYKGDWNEVLTWLVSYVRDLMVYKETGREELVINLDKIERIKDMSSMFSFNKLNDIINIVNETRQKLESNVNTSYTFNNMLLKFLDT